jgi:L-ascorbate metabolism protein UlaG (beta-lactamase superfamily)
VHMGPDEAMKVFHDLGSRWLIPMHYGTFKLSFEQLDEPPRWLKELADRDGVSNRLRILEEGVPQIF